MLNYPVNSNDIRLLLSEVIWLELEDFDNAIDNSKFVNSEAQQWQTYLNTLASIGCEKWLSTRIPQKVICKETNVLEDIYHLHLGDYKICPIAIEHLLDEVVKIPSSAAVHFYVVVEVLEEEEQVIIRGVLRYDELMNYRNQFNLELRDGYYQVPLSLFDTELNHLLFYYYFSEPLAIPLPVTSAQSSLVSLQRSLNNTITKLSEWLEGVFEQSWQTIDTLINPEANLALSTRITQRGAKKAKLIDLGVQLGYKTVALLVNITEESDEKLGVLIQVHPTGGERYLPPDLKLTLLSKAGKTLQEVTSRLQDNYIQLKFFKGESGKRFSVELSLGENRKVKEDFEL
ncbi:hypothetical protein DP113_15655 [Brasilonema octagenarum UFV-E1]|uniref:DUF1822 family protein n=2 Tax=Brasilonema TaxID=383614 RepID=A0A856MFV5_9CYAN|nr:MULTISPECIES: DUF1822 family protein [Brasilonema]NMF63204.1 hypothetical protein [Brasilonema octagenarum UFV-OR1]QDL09154.1 hypothetical protein DP114_15720 [Brasilonema sennae CENA114]QDL15511.1 hypothetical protein DP113_15655 [Brasilonema octagenarum UFV-E1]